MGFLSLAPLFCSLLEVLARGTSPRGVSQSASKALLGTRTYLARDRPYSAPRQGRNRVEREASKGCQGWHQSVLAANAVLNGTHPCGLPFEALRRAKERRTANAALSLAGISPCRCHLGPCKVLLTEASAASMLGRIYAGGLTITDDWLPLCSWWILIKGRCSLFATFSKESVF